MIVRFVHARSPLVFGGRCQAQEVEGAAEVLLGVVVEVFEPQRQQLVPGVHLRSDDKSGRR